MYRWSWLDVQMDLQMDGWVHERINHLSMWTDDMVDGWNDSCMNEQMSRQMTDDR